MRIAEVFRERGGAYPAVEVDFHVARAFELFKDHIVHARAGVDVLAMAYDHNRDLRHSPHPAIPIVPVARIAPPGRTAPGI
jgi:hypothetical protein